MLKKNPYNCFELNYLRLGIIFAAIFNIHAFAATFPPSFPFQMIGSVGCEAQTVAVIIHTPSGTKVYLKPGQALHGFVLISVLRNKLTFDRNGKIVVLHRDKFFEDAPALDGFPEVFEGRLEEVRSLTDEVPFPPQFKVVSPNGETVFSRAERASFGTWNSDASASRME